MSFESPPKAPSFDKCTSTTCLNENKSSSQNIAGFGAGVSIGNCDNTIANTTACRCSVPYRLNRANSLNIAQHSRNASMDARTKSRLRRSSSVMHSSLECKDTKNFKALFNKGTAEASPIRHGYNCSRSNSIHAEPKLSEMHIKRMVVEQHETAEDGLKPRDIHSDLDSDLKSNLDSDFDLQRKTVTLWQKRDIERSSSQSPKTEVKHRIHFRKSKTDSELIHKQKVQNPDTDIIETFDLPLEAYGLASSHSLDSLYQPTKKQHPRDHAYVPRSGSDPRSNSKRPLTSRLPQGHGIYKGMSAVKIPHRSTFLRGRSAGSFRRALLSGLFSCVGRVRYLYLFLYF